MQKHVPPAEGESYSNLLLRRSGSSKGAENRSDDAFNWRSASRVSCLPAPLFHTAAGLTPLWLLPLDHGRCRSASAAQKAHPPPSPQGDSFEGLREGSGGEFQQRRSEVTLPRLHCCGGGRLLTNDAETLSMDGEPESNTAQQPSGARGRRSVGAITDLQRYYPLPASSAPSPAPGTCAIRTAHKHKCSAASTNISPFCPAERDAHGRCQRSFGQPQMEFSGGPPMTSDCCLWPKHPARRSVSSGQTGDCITTISVIASEAAAASAVVTTGARRTTRPKSTCAGKGRKIESYFIWLVDVGRLRASSKKPKADSTAWRLSPTRTCGKDDDRPHSSFVGVATGDSP